MWLFSIKQAVSRIRWHIALAPVAAYCGTLIVSNFFQWEGVAICLALGFGFETASILSGRKLDNMRIALGLWAIGFAFLYSVFEDFKKSVLISIGVLCFQASVYFLPESIQSRINFFSCSFKEATKQVSERLTQKVYKTHAKERERNNKQ